MFVRFSKKFPAQTSAIDELARSDPNLLVVLNDYEEICEWLAEKEPSVERTPKEIERAQALARDLEKEILYYLENSDDSRP